MKISIRKGFGFGLTSGIITTLGLIVGLYSGTHSKFIVIGGILVIAIADALSDAFGMHISEESEGKHKPSEIWESTVSTLLFKFIFASTFVFPMLIFQNNIAIVVSVIWGLSLLSIFSYCIAKHEKSKPIKVIVEHLAIAILVVIITYYVGIWVAAFS